MPVGIIESLEMIDIRDRQAVRAATDHHHQGGRPDQPESTANLEVRYRETGRRLAESGFRTLGVSSLL